MYIEFDALYRDECAADRGVTSHMLFSEARDILSPDKLDVKDVAW
ncbi:hypothetical protein [uncultured Pelagimonas sp.]|nr:hypothetical protein [uncultured Pelagimonas sp.]